MSIERVLVAGATGRQGGAVADHLLTGTAGRTFQVDALTRHPGAPAARALAEAGAHVVGGDLADGDRMRALMADVDAVFCVTDFQEHGYDGEVRQGVTMAEAAADAGVEHYVYSSVGGAERRSGVPHFQSKWKVEQRIRDLGLDHTIVRPTYLMQNLEAMREEVLAGRLAMPLKPGVTLQMVDVDDVGAMVALALAHPGAYTGRAIEVAGDAHTLEGMATVFGRVTGGRVEPVHVPLREARERHGGEHAAMFDWLNRAGFAADIHMLSSELGVGLTTLESYLRGHGWEQAARVEHAA